MIFVEYLKDIESGNITLEVDSKKVTGEDGYGVDINVKVKFNNFSNVHAMITKNLKICKKVNEYICKDFIPSDSFVLPSELEGYIAHCKENFALYTMKEGEEGAMVSEEVYAVAKQGKAILLHKILQNPEIQNLNYKQLILTAK